MEKVNYWVFRFFVGLFKLLPFSIIYAFSDILSWFLSKILRYRYKTISENIDLAYPSISNKNKSILIKSIYKNLGDIMMEAIKGLTLTDDEIRKRHVFVNSELLDEAYEQGKSVILLSGHYNNWEWAAFSSVVFLKHKSIGFFKPMTNRYINDYVIKKRAKNGCILADINLTSQFYRNFHEDKAAFLVAGDQSPTKPELAVWTEFMGIQTPCLHGVEKYIERYDLPVVFCHIERVSRGKYEIHMEWLRKLNAPPAKYGDTTKLFMKKLENKILENPSSWLWSHRRWKHKDYKKVK